MGIPGFSIWFTKRNRDALVRADTVTVDHLYIDMNSLLHTTLRSANSISMFHAKLGMKLDEILRIARPRKSIMLAVDGPAPLAKLLTQRERRKKAARSEQHKKASGKKSYKCLSSNVLTPGTLFMSDLQLALSFWVCSRLSSRKYQGLVVELSGHTVQGEGEVKILSRLLRPLNHVQPGDTHMMVADDADVVLMALVCCVENLYVLSGNMHLEDGKGGTYDMTMPAFSTRRLHETWEKLAAPSHAFPQGVTQKMLGLRADMAVLVIISEGNDYIPGVEGLRFTHGSVWPTYLKLRRMPQWSTRSIISVQDNGHVVLDAAMLAEVIAACTGTCLADCVLDREDKSSKNAEEYLLGVVWVMDMYFAGWCPDWRWLYKGWSPSAAAVCTALLKHTTPITLGSMAPGATSPDKAEGREPLLPHVFAMALLGSVDRPFLPRSLWPIMEEDSPVHSLYATDCATCESFRERKSEIGVRLEELNDDIGEKEVSARLNAEHNKALRALLAEQAELRQTLRQVLGDSQEHTDTAHPHTHTFPIDALESAVLAIPESNFHPNERHLTNFSNSCIIRVAQGRVPHLYFPPPTPVAKWQPLSNYTKFERFAVVESRRHVHVVPEHQPAHGHTYLLPEHQNQTASPPRPPRQPDHQHQPAARPHVPAVPRQAIPPVHQHQPPVEPAAPRLASASPPVQEPPPAIPAIPRAPFHKELRQQQQPDGRGAPHHHVSPRKQPRTSVHSTSPRQQPSQQDNANPMNPAGSSQAAGPRPTAAQPGTAAQAGAPGAKAAGTSGQVPVQVWLPPAQHGVHSAGVQLPAGLQWPRPVHVTPPAPPPQDRSLPTPAQHNPSQARVAAGAGSTPQPRQAPRQPGVAAAAQRAASKVGGWQQDQRPVHDMPSDPHATAVPHDAMPDILAPPPDSLPRPMRLMAGMHPGHGRMTQAHQEQRWEAQHSMAHQQQTMMHSAQQHGIYHQQGQQIHQSHYMAHTHLGSQQSDHTQQHGMGHTRQPHHAQQHSMSHEQAQHAQLRWPPQQATWPQLTQHMQGALSIQSRQGGMWAPPPPY